MILLSVAIAVCPHLPLVDTEIHRYHPRTWYADCLAGPASGSPDGKFLVYQEETEWKLHDCRASKTSRLVERLGWTRVFGASWGATGHELLVSGGKDGEPLRGWYDLDRGTFLADAHPAARAGAVLLGKDGTRVLWGEVGGKHGLWRVDADETASLLEQVQPPTALAASSDGRFVAVLYQNSAGWSNVRLFDMEQGTHRLLAEGLDAGYQRTPMEFSSAGEELMLSLVGAKRGTMQEKQQPDTARDLDIYAISTKTGELRLVVEGPGDDMLTRVTDKRLTWTKLQTSMRVAVLPLAGGELTEFVRETSSFPTWHPRGDQLAVMFGEFHVADWALNWDIGVVDIAEDGSGGPLESLVAGPHEDFGPAYSPDGLWVAYHSHRSATPAARYNSPDATDDIWMCRADGSGEEIKLSSNPGAEVCQPSWSPGGDELIFIAISPRTGRYRALIVAIDPETGEPLEQFDFVAEGVQGHVIAASFSPSGNDVALEESLADGTRRVWIVDRASLQGRVLATYHSLPEFSGLGFSPDGETLFYTALAGGHHQLFSVSVEGGDPKQWTHLDEEVFCPQVSPDGARVAFTLYHHTKTVLQRNL